MSDTSTNMLGYLPSIQADSLLEYGERLTGLSYCRLMGAYVYGSVASGCWNPDTSDVDIVLVGHSIAEPEAVRELEHLHREVELPIDATVATPEHLKVVRLNAPVGFLLKPVSKGEAILRPEGSRDFVVQCQEVHEKGVALFGPDPHDLFQPVPWLLVRRYVDYLLPFISSRFKNPVLMLCRCAHTVAFHKMGSKKESGEWALATMPPQWRSLIANALAEYSGDKSAKPLNQNRLAQFDKYIAEWITKKPNQAMHTDGNSATLHSRR